MKKNKNYLIIIISVIFIFCLYLFLNNIHPFGTNSIYFRDLKDQYFYYIYNFKYRLINGLSLKYSFNSGLGIPFYKLFITYLSCPLMFLCIIFKDIQTFIFSYILFFLILSGISMYSLFKYKYKKDSIYFILISLSYSFSGWIFSYYEHIQWLPVIALLPLIIKYLEKLIKENKILGYFIFLVLSILCNYYISMYVCVFIFLYYFLYNLFNKSFNIKNIILFIITSILSAGVISVFLVPFIYGASGSTSSSSHVFYTDVYIYNASFIEYIYRLFSYSLIDRVGNDIKGPNISLSIVSLIFVFNYLFSKSNNYKTKVLYISLLLIYFIPFTSIEINYMFNFMHIGNGGFFRYSFIFIFIMCLMAGEASLNIQFNIKRVLISLILFISIITLVYFNYENADIKFLIINIVFIILYLLTIKFSNYKFIRVLLIALFISEVVLSFSLNNISSKKLVFNYDVDNNYRSEIKTSDYTYVDELLNNSYYNNRYSLSTYSSLVYNDVYDFMSKIGIETYYNTIHYVNDLSLYHLLFNIKYVNDNGEVKENDDTNGYMFMINDNSSELDNNSINNMNKIFKDFTGKESLFKSIKYKNKNVEVFDNYTLVTYTFKTKKDIYYYFDDDNIISYSDTINNKGVIKVDDVNTSYNISSTNKVIVFYSHYDESTKDGLFYTFDSKKFNEGLDYLKTKQVDIKEFKEDYIKAECNTSSNSYIYTSIPYDEGWSVYVNGKRINTYKYKDTFLMFDINKGENIIELKYNIPHFKLGLILSICSLFAFGLLYLISKK